MIFDIIIVLILLGCAIYGFVKGFVYTLIHTVGWIGGVVLSFLAVPYVESFLRNNTGAYKWVYSIVGGHFDSSSLSTLDSAVKSMPSVLTPSVTNHSTNIIDGVTSSFTNVFFTILVFVLLFIIFKIILWLVLRLLSKDYRSGFTNFVDGFFGIILGLLKGAVLVIVALAVLVAVATITPPDMSAFINKQMEASLVAQEVYNNNVLLIILQAFFK